MHFELTEAPREGDVLGGREQSFAEEDHLVVVEVLPEVGDDLVPLVEAEPVRFESLVTQTKTALSPSERAEPSTFVDAVAGEVV